MSKAIEMVSSLPFFDDKTVLNVRFENNIMSVLFHTYPGSRVHHFIVLLDDVGNTSYVSLNAGTWNMSSVYSTGILTFDRNLENQFGCASIKIPKDGFNAEIFSTEVKYASAPDYAYIETLWEIVAITENHTQEAQV